MSTCRSRSAWTWWRARRCSPPPASTAAWCRSARSAGARRTSSRPRSTIVKAGPARQDRPRRDLLLLPHARQRATRRSRRRPTTSTTRCGPARAPLRPYDALAAPALVADVHGIRQRHRGRHVHPHARHGPLDARPRLAQARQLRRRHLRAEGRQVEHLRHADRDVRLRRPSTWSGSTAPGAPRPTRSIPGRRSSTATRARSRPAS